MTISEARVKMTNASSYLRRLCQHWALRFQVEFFQVGFRDEHGPVRLPEAPCRLTAAPDVLTVRLECAAGADERRMQEVVEEHLQRFGFRETLEFH